MDYNQLFEQIKAKKSFLCVGLDSDIAKIPPHLLQLEDPVFEFNKAVIDATAEVAIAYKPNIAFYESRGVEGWKSLEKTIHYIRTSYPDIFTIADAKRGDIGNTSQMYAKAFLETLAFDSITVAPYMGEDSIAPFMGYPGKWVVLLALTSNKGSADFQQLQLSNGERLYEQVLRTSLQWGTPSNMMYVVGATQATHLEHIRTIVPDHFLLVPGVGAQGGSLREVAQYGMTRECGLLVNSSRGIIYASSEADYAEVAGAKAAELQSEMSDYLRTYAGI